MANARGKKVDKTFLSIDNAETRGFLHRDYIAHCFRWTHVVKYMGQSMRYKTSRVLDVGCGKEMPLAKLLHSSRMGPAWYGAVDVSALTTPEQFRNASWKPHQIFSKTDVCDLTEKDLPAKPNVIVNFEVAEHIEPDHCRRMLAKFGELLEPEGRLFISTPCYDANVGAAANHVNEMTYEAFGAVLEDTGFRVQGHWGTFASQKDYKSELTPELQDLFDKFRGYYDSNMLATIFAPLFPHRSRNVLWELTFDPSSTDRLFNGLRDVPTPWGSSDNWEALQC